MLKVVDAAGCMSRDSLRTVTDFVVSGDEAPMVYTDNEYVRDYFESKYGKDSCVFNDNLICLWMQIKDGATLLLTDIRNITCAVFDDIKRNYDVICVGE